MRLKMFFLSLLVLIPLSLIYIYSASNAAPFYFYTPSANVTIEMYELNTLGESTGNSCTSTNTKWGCTAFCDNTDPATGVRWGVCGSGQVKPYPFDSSTESIKMESQLKDGFQQGYLYNVTPHEVAITVSSQGNKSLSTVQAQAIAARTYAYYHVDENSTINNSNQFQVYIPYTYEKLTTAQQQRVVVAMSQVLYMSPTTGNDAIRAHYGADNGPDTTDGGETYLKSVSDPINDAYGCLNPNGGHYENSHPSCGTGNGGMSSKGASRWGFGHTSSRGAVAKDHSYYPHDNQGYGDPWSVRWDDAKQILTHYYTGIHIRDAADNNRRLTPAYRWNPLSVDWGNGATSPSQMLQGQTYNVTVNLQNTGTVNWTSSQDVRLSCRWRKPDGSFVNCSNNTAKIIRNVGTQTTVTLPVTPDANFVDGAYTLLIDAKQGSSWFYNRDIGNNRPWFALEYPVCVGQKGCQVFLPLVLKNWPPVYLFETFGAGQNGWIYYTIPSSNHVSDYVYIYPDGHTDGNSLFIGEGNNYHAGAKKYVAVPPGSSLKLSLWCKEAPEGTPGYSSYHIYINGHHLSGPTGCPNNWDERSVTIPSNYTATGQILLDLRVFNYPAAVRSYSLFDDIKISLE